MSETPAVYEAVEKKNYGVVNFEEYAMGVENIVKQIDLIHTVMERVMKDGEHYGVIPGCGTKPSLLKPGAEKLGVTFRLAPSYKIIERDLLHGHREYEVVTTLTHIPTGQIIGEGVGSCSTLESKYRFRTGEVEFIGKAVPSEYWKDRDIKLLGGKGFVAKKNPDTGKWEIARQGEKVEYENPADYYNTCLKMAKKRSQVDAILTATAASDIFTQDMEDIVDSEAEENTSVENNKVKEEKAKTPEPEMLVEKEEDKVIVITPDEKRKEMADWFSERYGEEAMNEFKTMCDGKISNPLMIKNSNNLEIAWERYRAKRQAIEEAEGGE